MNLTSLSHSPVPKCVIILLPFQRPVPLSGRLNLAAASWADEGVFCRWQYVVGDAGGRRLFTED